MRVSSKNILGISAYYHDAAAVVLIDGKVIAAAQEERFTRVKHTEAFPSNAIKYCLEESGLTLNQLDAIVFYEKPFLKFERLLQTYYSFSPKGIWSFLKAMPIWLSEKLFIKKKILESLAEIEPFDKKKIKLLFSSHHLSHAASAFYCSPFQEATILTVDGVGEWDTATIGIGSQNKIKIIKEMHFPHSVGLLYSAFTYFLGFKVNSGEYKLMGLAPYGQKNAAQTHNFIEIITSKLVHIFEDGSIWLDQNYFEYAFGLRMVNDKKWQSIFGFPKRNESEEITQNHCNLALAIQLVTEEIVLKLATEAITTTGIKNLCLSGGVALNCVANGKLLTQNSADDIYIQPASGDAGGALGAAFAVHYMYFNQPRTILENPKIEGYDFGPSFSEKEILSMTKKNRAVFELFIDKKEVMTKVANLIQQGNCIGWFQGKMEFGPRALGNRSILANASMPQMQKKLNLKIKNREGFRPFAPSVLAEDASTYFKINQPSPYMLFTAEIQDEYKVNLPKNYDEMSFWQKLYTERTHFSAITHLDYSARIQTVDKETYPVFHQLLTEYKAQTGVGMLINTSFNVRGEPIVCTPEDAYKCFMNTEMDYLVIENFVFKKQEQPFWEDKEKWALVFKND
jgi:carbamoyltransferase